MLGDIRLQALTSLDLEAYYAGKKTLADATLELHHMVISGALEAAVRSRLLAENVAGG